MQGTAWRAGAGLVAWSFMTACVFAADAPAYPAKPIRFVVPYPPGGGTDTIARLFSPRMTQILGQPVIIDNRGGANGIIGTDVAAKSSPDGYTMVFCIPANIAVNPVLYKKLPYDPLRDLAPVIQLDTLALLIVVHPAVAIRTVDDLVRLARAKPDELNFSSSGHGSSGHLAIELVKSMAKLNMTHVPFKGGGLALNAVMTGEVQLSAGTVISELSHVKSGRLRPVAVTTDKRIASLPEVPTIGETLPGYSSFIWHGVAVPARTPAAVVQRLNRSINETLQSAEVRERLIQSGAEPVGGTSEAFGALMRQEVAKYAKLLRETGLAGSESQ